MLRAVHKLLSLLLSLTIILGPLGVNASLSTVADMGTAHQERLSEPTTHPPGHDAQSHSGASGACDNCPEGCAGGLDCPGGACSPCAAIGSISGTLKSFPGDSRYGAVYPPRSTSKVLSGPYRPPRG